MKFMFEARKGKIVSSSNSFLSTVTYRNEVDSARKMNKDSFNVRKIKVFKWLMPESAT